ncbi:hypothetical protein EVAR_59165_1 [Eumeta japonica]|uniref:Uncharacterized protein n=1 Tax=Eumeta variegata TaxID=151549 RepID=A0A4C1YSN7_EUMVA|nr:hypothetical protein EVAR_59165_1 [Eumeta japonica]
MQSNKEEVVNPLIGDSPLRRHISDVGSSEAIFFYGSKNNKKKNAALKLQAQRVRSRPLSTTIRDKRIEPDRAIHFALSEGRLLLWSMIYFSKDHSIVVRKRVAVNRDYVGPMQASDRSEYGFRGVCVWRVKIMGNGKGSSCTMSFRNRKPHKSPRRTIIAVMYGAGRRYGPAIGGVKRDSWPLSHG